MCSNICTIIRYYNIQTWDNFPTWPFSTILMEIFNKEKYGNDYLCHRYEMVDVN